MNNDELLTTIFESTLGSTQLTGTITEVIPPTNSIEERSDSGLRRNQSGDITFTTRNVNQTKESIDYHAQLVRYDPHTKTTPVVLTDTVQLPHHIGHYDNITSQYPGNRWEEAHLGALLEYDFVAANVVVARSVAFPADFAKWNSFSRVCTSTMHPQVPARGQVVFYQLESGKTTPVRKQVFDLTGLYYQHAISHADQPEVLRSLNLSPEDIPVIQEMIRGQYPSQNSSSWPGLSMDSHTAMSYDPIAKTVLLKHNSRGCFHQKDFYQTLEIKEGKIHHDFTSYKKDEPAPLAERMKVLNQERNQQNTNPEDLQVVHSRNAIMLQRQDQQSENSQPLASLREYDIDFDYKLRLTLASPWRGDLAPIPLSEHQPYFVRRDSGPLLQASPTQYLFELLGRVYRLDVEQ